ncbi:MAG: hypothetical protein JWR69_3064 [Pedosphaera sp.]|nr:hypothetical protein [Pedosphaera sp.]
MNDKYKRLKTQFAADTRFEVPAIPFRATETTELERLKDRLLLQLLKKAVAPGQNVLLRRAANDAVALAWATHYPLLLFPILLEEKAEVALLQCQRQKQVRERSLSLALTTV